MNKQELIILLGEDKQANLRKVKNGALFYANGYAVNTEDTITNEYNGDGGVVFSLSKDGEKKYWKIPGWYSSEEGLNLEIFEIFEVKPEPVEVINWKAV